MSTPELILRLAALLAALVCAGFGVVAVKSTDDAGGCLAWVLGCAAIGLCVTAFAGSPLDTP